MRLVEDIHYAVVDFRFDEWSHLGAINGKWVYCFRADSGTLKLAYITDPDINREDIRRHFAQLAAERKATARNRKNTLSLRKTAGTHES